MTANRQSSLLERILLRPPELEGGVRMQLELSDARHGMLSLEHEGQRLKLRAAALSTPYPSGLKRLLALEPDVEVVIVERIPPGLAAAAQEAGVGCLDRDGRGRVVGPGFVYVAQPAHTPAAAASPQRSSPFAPSASRVVRALLSDAARQWRLSDLAALVELNPGNVHRALAALQDAGYVERDFDSYVLVDPGSLLEAWADNSRPPKQRISLPIEGDLRLGAEDVVARLGGRGVISGELAAELLAPHLPAQSAIIHCLDHEAWDRIEREGSPLATPWTPSAGRLLLDLPDAGVSDFGGSVGGLDVVSPAQLYVDLARAPGRARQAAEEVRRQRLRY